MSIDNPVTALSEDQCWSLLAGTEVGRLATTLNREPEIFPMNYVVDGESIVFRTAEGNKLLEMTMNETVAFEIDGWNEEEGWSVVLKGSASVIEESEELARAEALPLLPWVPTIKLNYVRVTPHDVSGRRFTFGPEPSRDC